MTPEYIIIAETRGCERAVIDYISGMTDRYAMDSFNNIFVPKVWAVE
jgi:dGTPase